MKLLIILLMLPLLVAAQSEKELFKNELSTYRDSEILMESDSLIKYRIGEEVNILDFRQPEENSKPETNFPILEIRLQDHDPADYEYIYELVQTLPGVNYWSPPAAADLNGDERTEVYLSVYDHDEEQFSMNIYEKDYLGIYRYADELPAHSFTISAIYDIDGDGRREVQAEVEDTIIINGNPTRYRKYFLLSEPSGYGYPSDTLFTHSLIDEWPRYQTQDYHYGDFNNDGITDGVFVIQNVGEPEMRFVEYNAAENKFEKVFGYKLYEPMPWISGMCYSDFDNDDKVDFMCVNANGDWTVVEVDDSNGYRLADSGTVNFVYCEIYTETNDIDGNGRNEFWFGGSIYPYHWRLFCFEAAADDTYEQVLQINLPFSFSMSVMRGHMENCDVDNDGNDELVLYLGTKIVILKFVGNPNEHEYKVLYYSYPEGHIEGPAFTQLPMYDYPVMLLGLYTRTNHLTDTSITKILKYHQATDIEMGEQQEDINNKVTLSTYPNPFNSECSIEFTLPEYSQVKITIYNSLGQQIGDIVNRPYEKGEHTLRLPMESLGGGGLSTGIYFLSLETCRQRIINKILYLK